MYWEAVVAKDLPQSGSESDGDLEHSTRKSPSARENVTNAELSDETYALAGSCNGCRTCENSSLVLNPLLEQTFRPCQSDPLGT